MSDGAHEDNREAQEAVKNEMSSSVEMRTELCRKERKLLS